MMDTLYINRPLLGDGVDILIGYAYAVGLKDVVDDLHVTVAFSTTEVDWRKDAFTPKMDQVLVKGDNRRLTRFGSAVVLEITSKELSKRWAQLVLAGASWDYKEYRPHVTLAYDPDTDFSDFPVPSIPLLFGAEEREPVDVGYIQSIE